MTVPPAPSPPPGSPVNRSTTDITSGQLSQQIQVWCLNVTNFNAWLSAQTEDVLEAPPFDYSAENVALLKSAVADMVTLTELFLGTVELSPARDLSVFVKQLAGVRLVS
jgi:hypothetical protein